MPKSLKTKNSVWTTVFRRIVQQLETNPDVKRVVGLANLRSWKGVSGDKAPFAPTSTAPVVRLTPQPQNVEWYSPDEQAGTLAVQIEIGVNSLCLDDVVDLWDLIVGALQPGGTPIPSSGISFSQDLVAVGAETGEIVFSDPAFDPQPMASDEGYFFAAGHFRLRCLRPVS